MRKNRIIIIVIFNFLLTKCKSESDDDIGATSQFCSTQACEREAKNILDKIDTSIDACDDFYMHVCGNFIKNTVIPDDKTSVDVSTVLDENLKKQINSILNMTISEHDIEPFKYSKKLYKACINQELIQEQGLKPMKKYHDLFGGWPVVEGKNWQENVRFWQKVLLQLEMTGFDSNYLFACSVQADLKNSSRRLIYIDQMVLSMDREYLVKGFDDENVQAYYNYQVDTAVIYGADRFAAELEMKDVLNFEIQLANISTPREERRNMTLLYNPITIKDFQHVFPIHDWYKYFNKIIENNNITEDEVIIMTDFQNIMDELYNLLKYTPNRVVVNYLVWRASSAVADLLNDEVRNRYIEFRGNISGQKSFEERWEECIELVLTYLPISTSALYVRNFFEKESRDTAWNIVTSIRNEFENTINNTEWMDDKTKARAMEKAKAMVMHIGYPDELLDNEKLLKYYKGIAIDERNLFESILNISRFETQKLNSNLRKLVNKTNWEDHSRVAVINAFYNPAENSIQVPAGILQGVYFAADRPRYLNFAAIGATIGHEITHGFDDEGSQFDSDGNVVDWWQEDTKKAYLEKAKCIIEQYSNLTEPITGLNVNGINTQGENIADNGGIKLAYNAYLKYLSENDEELPLPRLNYTSKQLFWVSAAVSWCTIERPEYLKLLITGDPHAPEHFRVNAPLSNMPEFSEDFNCPADSKMNSENKCKVW